MSLPSPPPNSLRGLPRLAARLGPAAAWIGRALAPKSLRGQFTLALSGLALLILASGIVALYALRAATGASQHLVETYLAQMSNRQDLVQETLLIARKSDQLLTANSTEEVREIYSEILGHLEALDSLVALITVTSTDSSVLDLHQAGQLFGITANIAVQLREDRLKTDALFAAALRYRIAQLQALPANDAASLIALLYRLQTVSRGDDVRSLQAEFRKQVSAATRLPGALRADLLRRQPEQAADGEPGTRDPFALRQKLVQGQDVTQRIHGELQRNAVAMVAVARVLSANLIKDYKEAAHELSQATLRTEGGLLLLVATSLLFAWLIVRVFMGRHVLVRLQQVSDYLRRNDTVDTQPVVPVSGQDEIGDMARALEQFMRARSLNAELERRVHERTAELMQANARQKAEIEERKRVEDALQQARDDLERRVDERTLELTRANNRLEQEIVKQRQSEETLRESEARIRRLVESNIVGVFFWDLGGQISDANDAFLQIVNYQRDDLLSGSIDWTRMTPPEYLAADARASDELRATGSCNLYEKEYVRKDGSRVPVLVGGALFEGSPDKGVGFALDISKRKRAEERVRYMAQHDALTDLPNRGMFRDRITQAIAQAHRERHQVAVLFIDLDHFKHINDSLGHQTGDLLLQAAAQRLQDCLRGGDSIARLGGDEFVIGLPAILGSDAVLAVADKVLDALRRPFVISHNELHVSASLGICLYPADGQDADTLMRAADTAMYHAKEKGRDNYQFFTSGLNEAAQRRLSIANRLHQAFPRGEFLLHYQPQVDLESGLIFGAEALIRWLQTDAEPVPTGEFIKVAEDTGLIVALGEWVLRQACGQAARWRLAGHADLRIAVNLSPHQFLRPGFPALAARILDETKLPAAALEMEITEGVLTMQNPENMATLRQLADMGVGLSVDDFGTGYASLAYLQRFPIDALKIDQSFVHGIGRDANDTAIVTAIIAMAHSLRLKVVAEGVETADQAVFLKARGCFAAQGYHFSTPVSAEAFLELLSRQAEKPPISPMLK